MKNAILFKMKVNMLIRVGIKVGEDETAFEWGNE